MPWPRTKGEWVDFICDVTAGTKCFPSQEEIREKSWIARDYRSKMPGRCVVGGCSNTASLEKGIGLHVIPFFGDTRPEAKKRRKQWVDFVKLKRAKWEPSKSSVICSAHFHPTDFERRFHSLPGQSLQFPRLHKDEIGVWVYPTVQVGSTQQSQTERSKRKVRIFHNDQL